MFVDSHAHLEALLDIDGVLARAKNEGVGTILTIGTDLESSKQEIRLATSYPNIYASVGIHPGDGKDDVKKLGIAECMSNIREISKSSERVVAIGEAGLDYFSNETRKGHAGTSETEKEYQRELFVAQIKLAEELSLPIVVHCRNAWKETFEVLTRSDMKLTQRGVFHSFTGGPDEAKRAVELGFYVSFSGIVTFKNAQNIQDAAKIIPLERILLETDSPYLSPEPIRGSQNEPKNVRIIGQFLAKHLNLPLGRIEEQTSENAHRLFNLD